jgi:hypothetical protein
MKSYEIYQQLKVATLDVVGPEKLLREAERALKNHRQRLIEKRAKIQRLEEENNKLRQLQIENPGMYDKDYSKFETEIGKNLREITELQESCAALEKGIVPNSERAVERTKKALKNTLTGGCAVVARRVEDEQRDLLEKFVCLDDSFNVAVELLFNEYGQVPTADCQNAYPSPSHQRISLPIGEPLIRPRQNADRISAVLILRELVKGGKTSTPKPPEEKIPATVQTEDAAIAYEVQNADIGL